MTRTLRAALLLALCASPARAAGVGTTAAPFLKVGIGARPLAMGSAFSALPDDANAINWNPGALGEVKARNVTVSYNSLFQDENQGFFGYASPLRDGMGTLGFGVNYLMVSKIEKRAADTENPDSTFSNQNYAVSLSYGRAEVREGLSLGGTFKYIRETIDYFSASAVAVDLGASYKTRVPGLRAGLSLQNFGTRLGPDPLPLLLKGGAAYTFLGKTLTVAADLDCLLQDQRTYLDFGMEYWAQKSLAVRAGYQLGRGQDNLGSGLVGASFGLGMRLDRLTIDYAFLPFGNLGDTHRMTVGVRF